MTDIIIKEIDIKDIKNYPICILGPDVDSRLNIVNWYCYHNREQFASVICITSNLYGFKYIPTESKYYMYSSVILKYVYKKQQDTKDKMLIILDDMVNQIDKTDKEFIALFTTSRHQLITPILIMNDITQLWSLYRKCFGYLIIKKEDQKRRRKLLYDQFWNDSWCSYEDFNKILEKCTEDNKSLVIKLCGIDGPGMSKSVYYLDLLDTRNIPEFEMNGLDHIEIDKIQIKKESKIILVPK
jgi:hypothetical protein